MDNSFNGSTRGVKRQHGSNEDSIKKDHLFDVTIERVKRRVSNDECIVFPKTYNQCMEKIYNNIKILDEESRINKNDDLLQLLRVRLSHFDNGKKLQSAALTKVDCQIPIVSIKNVNNLMQCGNPNMQNIKVCHKCGKKLKNKDVFCDTCIANFLYNGISIGRENSDVNLLKEKPIVTLEIVSKAQRSTPIHVFPGWPDNKITDFINLKMSRPLEKNILPDKILKIRDLLTAYLPKSWLNDEVINYYISMLVERDARNIYAHNTFFFNILISRGYTSVQRWSKGKDLFSYKKIFIPIHVKKVHWCLVCIDFDEKTITYYDSWRDEVEKRSGENRECLIKIFEYLREEHRNKKGEEELDYKGWRLITSKDHPKQTNCYDCGVFTCMNAEYLARDAKLDFTQEDITILRNRMCYEILKDKLCYLLPL